MAEGKDRYEERRAQEHANEMARLRMTEADYVSEKAARELFTSTATALNAFLVGKACFLIEPLGDGRSTIRFVIE